MTTKSLPSWSIALKDTRLKNNLSQTKFAEKLNIYPTHLSEMENGRRALGKNLAKRIGSIFNCDYRMFL